MIRHGCNDQEPRLCRIGHKGPLAQSGQEQGQPGHRLHGPQSKQTERGDQTSPVPQGHDARGVGAIRHSAHVACQAEVAHLELPLLAQQQVAGLQVPVEHPAAMQVRHPLQQLRMFSL